MEFFRGDSPYKAVHHKVGVDGLNQVKQLLLALLLLIWIILFSLHIFGFNISTNKYLKFAFK